MGIGGLVLLDKPSGISSFNCLTIVKKCLNTTRVGHVGTLDPSASGLLGVLTNKCTKLSMLFNDLNKTYLAVIRFGKETSTGDIEGKIIAEAPIPSLDIIKSVSKSFIGSIKQVPPVYSAIKINGHRAYTLARKGKSFHIPERKVTIYDFKINKWSSPDLYIELTCSSGTYVRSFARDLGLASESRAYLHSLKRISIGPFSIEQAVKPHLFQESDIQIPEEFIKKLNNVKCINVSEAVCQKISLGQKIQPEFFNLKGRNRIGCVGVFSKNNLLLAILRRKSGEKLKESECNYSNSDSEWNYMCVLRN